MNASPIASAITEKFDDDVVPEVEHPPVLPGSVPASCAGGAASWEVPESFFGGEASVDASLEASLPASAGAGAH